jgi:hypothetical protein
MALHFTTSWHQNFSPAGLACVKSVRKFYPSAPIWAMLEEPTGAGTFEQSERVIRAVQSVGGKVLETHEISPLKTKVYIQRYVIDRLEPGDVMVYLDADAFLLAPITKLLNNAKPDTVQAVNTREPEGLPFYREITGEEPIGFNEPDWRLNAGFAIYGIGKGVKKFAKTLTDVVANEYLWAIARHDQNISRSLLAYAARKGWLTVDGIVDSAHWNPMPGECPALSLHDDGRWINHADGKQQFIYHAIGPSSKPWLTPKHPTLRIAFDWVQS